MNETAAQKAQAQVIRMAVHTAHMARLEARLGKRVEFTCTRCRRHVIAYGKATGCGRQTHVQPTQ